VVSFSRTAAQELAARDMGRPAYVGTAHALAFKLLNLGRAQVADPERFAEEYGDRQIVEEALSVGHTARAARIPLHDAFLLRAPIVGYSVCSSIWADYLAWQEAEGLIDFDGMLERGEYRGSGPVFDDLIVDEAQDLSPAQWAFLVSTVRDPARITLGGDDDQAIFTWAGASPRLMLDVVGSGGAGAEVLSQSYRLPVAVHAAAEQVVGRIGRRHPKVYAPRPAPGRVVFSGFYEPPPEPHTVLARHGAPLEAVEAQLIDQGVPFTFRGRRSGPLDGPTARVARACLAHDLAALRRNERYLSPLALQALEQGCVLPDWADALHPARTDFRTVGFLKVCGPDAEPLVHLSTIHGFKGREADHVVLLADMPLPSEAALGGSQTALDDEIRVWYVGLTRARETLNVIGYNDLLADLPV
jgi:DNA helicase-2/ATP-dependent DNA helicase PcrA